MKNRTISILLAAMLVFSIQTVEKYPDSYDATIDQERPLFLL